MEFLELDTDAKRSAYIAAQIPGADPSMLSINQVKDVMAAVDKPNKTQEEATLYIACRQWLGTW